MRQHCSPKENVARHATVLLGYLDRECRSDPRLVVPMPAMCGVEALGGMEVVSLAAANGSSASDTPPGEEVVCKA